MNFFWVKVNYTQSFQLQLLLSYWKYHWCVPTTGHCNCNSQMHLAYLNKSIYFNDQNSCSDISIQSVMITLFLNFCKVWLHVLWTALLQKVSSENVKETFGSGTDCKSARLWQSWTYLNWNGLVRCSSNALIIFSLIHSTCSTFHCHYRL